MLGAGEGWAKSILFNAARARAFAAFFARQDTFALGVCNGCQMMSNLKELIPGAEHWPRFVRNRSEQFEARLSLVRVEKTPSLFFRAWRAPCSPSPSPTAKGAPSSRRDDASQRSNAPGLVAARFVDNHGEVDPALPVNPNGSPAGLTALTTPTAA